MYRYHLTASFDKEQKIISYEINEGTGWIDVTIPFVDGSGNLRYGLQTTVRDFTKNTIFPSEDGFDLILIGLMVYIADMKVSRYSQSQDTWSREFALTIPVFNERWKNWTKTFERMLKFLTGDFWTVEFTKRECRFAQADKEEQRSDTYEVASLFSGGMDSLIASINYMEQGKPTMLISHAGEPRVRHWQTDLMSVLDDKYPSVPHYNAYYWTNLESITLPETDGDLNQRSRSFLFIAISLWAMSGTKNLHELLMPENGLIALNVPLDYLRNGSHSTRTTHPYYLKLWNEIAGDIFGYSIRNPYWNKTKGEMASECLNKEVLKIAMGQSFSCSSVNSASIHSGRSQHCGHCLPCIIRRAAMHKAFGDFDPSEYMDSSVTAMMNDRGHSGEQLRSFQYAITKLKENPAASKFYIHIPGPLDMDEVYLNELADTYCRGLIEVDTWIQDSLEKEKHAD